MEWGLDEIRAVRATTLGRPGVLGGGSPAKGPAPGPEGNEVTGKRETSEKTEGTVFETALARLALLLLASAFGQTDLQTRAHLPASK